ncbi:hypothetical protein FHX44_116092 [Pseudonocardia hierapolitana]|uniref:Uncharacterized protein n=1 Tax=Pseudonocardia hierapolitana TaxID=1128676 RepID=A0A561SZ57_9PSEU|nr:hypothetical protein [Pseudonocardia hierapolitana]TWF80154.1 hypothetical protein FHX44_116092 [Pseudonocardia hierapolitana]
MTAPHQSPQKTAFAERPYPQEPHQQPHQPVHPPVAPGHHLRPWPVNPEQQQAHPDQPYRAAGQPEQVSGRQAADEELRRAQARTQGLPGGPAAEPPRPIFVRKQRFVALAWAALVFGIVGIVAGVVGVLVGSSIVVLKYLTIGLAVVGVLLGAIALLGTRKVLGGIGVVLCAGAIAVALTAQVATPEVEGTTGVGDVASQDVALRDCTVVRQDGAVTAEATLEITNRTAERQSYNINVTVNDKTGPRVGEINAIATTVAPGETVVLSGAQASGEVSGRAQAGPADCRIATVNRLALGG